MNIQNRMPVIGLHFQKAFVPQDAGIVDDNVHGAEGVQGAFDDFFTTFGCGHTVIIRNGLSAQCVNLVNDRVRRSF